MAATVDYMYKPFAQLLEVALAHFTGSEAEDAPGVDELPLATIRGMSMKTSSAWICAVNLSSKTPTRRIYSCTETKMTRTRRIRMNANVTIPFVTFERDARFKRRVARVLGLF